MPFNMEGIAVMSGAYPAVANMPFASHQGNYPARNYKVDKINGRKLSPMPAQLGRVLYVPHHEQGTRHIALSDVTSTYDEEMGDVQYGSSEYKRRLGIMKKPSETAEPQFVVDVASDGASLTVQDTSSEKGYKGHMTLASGPDDKGVLETTTPSGYEEGPYTFHTSLPLPGTARGPLTYQWPYFSIVESKDGSELEWRVYPVEKGGLCYMLVDKALLSPKAKSKDLPPDEAIQAIYHHIGYGEALPDTHSEGILVLPKERADDDQDVLTTMSLLGALRYSREYSHTETGKMTSHEKFQKLMSRVKGDK